MTRSTFVVALLVGSLLLVWSYQGRRAASGLVVYCAHDLVFAAPLLERFTDQTGIGVTIVGDTEASKSLGLVRRIEAEAAAPQGDVFWNNETLGTIALAEAGRLTPYQGDGWNRMPGRFRDPDGRWTGLAGRLRVVVRRTGDETHNADARLAIADPMYGTTLTHAAVVWARDDGATFRRMWPGLKSSDRTAVVAGNGPAMRLLSDRRASWCLTDTDDLFAIGRGQLAAGAIAFDARVPIDTLDPRTATESAVVMIPNTVAIVDGCDRMDDARRLVDWLLSESTERALANSPARQIPLGPTDPSDLPPLVQTGLGLVEESVDLRPLGPARTAVLMYLTDEAGGRDPAGQP